MSSKLVKNSLQQTAIPLTNKEHDQKRRKKSPINTSRVKSSKEMVQEHVQSILRLDNLVQRFSSATAQKSFNRHSANLRQQQKQKQNLKKNASGISNSRSSTSSFVKRPHEKTYDKEKEKRKREESYLEDLARVLKKANKSKKKRKSP